MSASVSPLPTRMIRSAVSPPGSDAVPARSGGAALGLAVLGGALGVGLLCALLELTDRLAERAAQLRYLRAPEHDEGDEQDDHQLLCSETKHAVLLSGKVRPHRRTDGSPDGYQEREEGCPLDERQRDPGRHESAQDIAIGVVEVTRGRGEVGNGESRRRVEAESGANETRRQHRRGPPHGHSAYAPGRWGVKLPGTPGLTR